MRVRTRTAEPAEDLLGRLPDGDGVVWVRAGEGLVGWGEALRVEVSGEDRVEQARDRFRQWCDGLQVTDEVALPGTGPVAFVSFTFDARSPGSVLVVPRVVLGRRGDRAWMTTVGDAEVPAEVRPLPPLSRIRYAGAGVSELAWLDAVAVAVRAIRAGQLDKVVLARDVQVWSDAPLDARVLATRLSRRFAGCYTFLCDGLVGATPELLLRRQGGTVESLVLAGSAPRGRDGAEDRQLADRLLASPKDRWEHELAVASVREVLEPRCAQLRIGPPRLLRLANVQHLATDVRGTLAAPASTLELAAALHPTAAVGGTPRKPALDCIRELETFDRGRYSGPVGWVDANGDGELGVALRCAQVHGSRATLFAGAGVVADSLPEAELEETRLKLRAMQSALEGW